MAKKKSTRKRTTAVKSKKKPATRKKAASKKKRTAKKISRKVAKKPARKAAKKPARKKVAGKARKTATKRAAGASAAALTPIEFARVELKQTPDSLGAHHSRMKPMAGEFRAAVKMWMGPGDPMEMTGTMVNSWDLGGRFLKQTYRGDGDAGPFGQFAGRGYWGYNDANGRWEGFWIDSASTMMHTETGHYDDGAEQWTMVGTLTNPETGQPMQKRSVFRVLDQNRHTMETWFAGPDGAEFKSMEIAFERI
ncbi:MAG: DUF1579 family protein [Phycisphaerales bacterium]